MPLSSMPDICIAYRLHLEYGKLIKMSDWLQAFAAVINPININSAIDDVETSQVNPELEYPYQLFYFKRFSHSIHYNMSMTLLRVIVVITFVFLCEIDLSMVSTHLKINSKISSNFFHRWDKCHIFEKDLHEIHFSVCVILQIIQIIIHICFHTKIYLVRTCTNCEYKGCDMVCYTFVFQLPASIDQQLFHTASHQGNIFYALCDDNVKEYVAGRKW